MLTPRNRTVADCPAATVLLSMVMPTTVGICFNYILHILTNLKLAKC